MLRAQAEAIELDKREERTEIHMKKKEAIKDMLCLGLSIKAAKGPNPLSVLRKKTVETNAIVG